MRIKYNNQRGDTIVEVLIALTVLMLIIGGGYSIATRSLNGVQIAQERSEATKIAEGQLEAINQKLSVSKTEAELNGYLSTATEPGFCIDGTGAAIAQTNGINDLAGYIPACITGDGGRYHIYISTTSTQLNPASPPDDGPKQLLYKISVVWPRSGGGTNETLEMASRYVVQ